MHKKEVRRRKNLRHRIKAFFLVGFLVVFSVVLALVLFSEQNTTLLGSSVAESAALQQAKVEKQTTILYLLGATVLVLLSAYCFLLYKRYI